MNHLGGQAADSSRDAATKRRSRILWAALVVAAVLMLGAFAMLGLDYLAYRGEIHHGVRVAGSSVGGLDGPEAHTMVEQAAARSLDRALVVTDGLDSVTLTLADSGAAVDVDSTVALAISQGRTGGFLRSALRRLSLWFRPVDIDPVFTLSGPGWQRAIDQVSLAFEKTPQNARLVIDGHKLTATVSEPGAVVEERDLKGLVLHALAHNADKIAPPLVATEPSVSTEQAAKAQVAAAGAFATPISLDYQGKSYLLTTNKLVTSTSVDIGSLAGGGLPLTLDNDAGRDLLSHLLAPLERPPVEAKVVPDKDGKGYKVTPSRDGVDVEWDALFPALAQALLLPTPRRVAVPTTVAEPKLTTEDAEQLATRRDIASFTTYFSSANEARVHNIRQVAALLDSTVVAPGAVFSFNKTVGPRTAAAGFDEAPVIRNGVLVPGVGGGTCQASTTLFNAVFLAGLPIVERHPHSLFVEHYPVGRDATVTFGSQDFRFRNDSKQFILISASATERSLTISLAAPSWDRQVAYSTSPFTRVTKPDSSADYPRYLRDPSLAAGTRLPTEPGIDGRTVQVFRVVTNATGKVLFRDDFTSVYAPKDFIVRVGPK